MEGDILLKTFTAGLFVAFWISTLDVLLLNTMISDNERALKAIQNSLGVVSVLLLAVVVFYIL